MRTLLLSLSIVLALVASRVQATTLGLGTLKLPVYLHGSDSDAYVQIIDVPFVAGGASPEWWVHALGLPFVPPSDPFWREKSDVNMVSRYGLSITCQVGNFDEDFEVTIDAKKAKIPEGYPFTIEQVVDSAATCVRLMYPDRPKGEGKLAIKIIPESANPEAPAKAAVPALDQAR
ncbi:hypothetical protein [Verrucomicrobium spinosum]|uniref:hypothetical protein n=1 Tax=Verrucomicrobium spinosum TaxID=2736 RepID=UPI0001745B92|nr:hypothetical protein [Verrucomicrobium spinosum]